MSAANKMSAHVILLGLVFFTSSAVIAAERALTFAVPGVVQEVMVRPGQKVGKGDPLARLDSRIFAACAKAGQARVEAAEAALEKARKGFSDTTELYDALSASAAQLTQARVSLKEAEADAAQARAREVRCSWRLEYSTLRAPAAGVVKSVPGYVGMVVNPRVRLSPAIVLRTQ